MEVLILGDLVVRDDRGEQIIFPRRQRRVRSLIATLALIDRPVSVRDLASLLWEHDDRDLGSAPSSLVYKVRKEILPPGRIVTETDEYDRQAYRLIRRPGDAFDIDRFASAMTLADRARRSGDLQRAADLYGEAVGLWRGGPADPPLPDLPDTLAVRHYTDPLLTRLRHAVEAHFEVKLELGRPGQEIAEQIRSRLRYDETNEHLHGLLMTALYRAGRATDALRAFKHAAEILDAELETSPGPALQRLRERIIEHHPTLDWNPSQVGSPPARIESGKIPTVRGTMDYLLGGKDNSSLDREFVTHVVESTGTTAHELPEEIRNWLVRVVRFLAKQGIAQFLDLGSGMPIPDGRNLHTVAEQITPDTRVLYVDNEPITAAHSNALMADGDRVIFLESDLSDVPAVLHRARAHFNLAQPVGLIFCNSLQYLGEADADLSTGPVAKIVQQYIDALAPGGYLAINTITGDDLDPQLRPFVDAADPAPDVPQELRMPQFLRSAEQIERFFCGLPLLEPGLTDVGKWRPTRPFVTRGMRIIGGVAAIG
ncbi:SAM-dependent methyltransferase [Actinomadura barringtoniae]|uniref:SAM-dependent methyltransferase n=1 Tax=Actinomadura barringtoniae TaxID=1427535 RepID=A0A939PE42_9ACTN|nr:SAM-dependent methyltransferase [Actinomadura barringtoniae]MBO2447559.1 SAM-dependent methyltransferase [Actinomadura barringtoniae]